MRKILVGAVAVASLMTAAAVGPVRAEDQNPQQNVQTKGNVHLSQERAQKITHALTAIGKAQDISLDAKVGSNLPGNADVRALPPNVVALAPEYQGYEYVVTPDEIIIVQPSTRRVVEVLRRSE